MVPRGAWLQSASIEAQQSFLKYMLLLESLTKHKTETYGKEPTGIAT